jgi:Ca-activated chloride channel family protein
VNPAALAKVANATNGTAFTAATGSELKQVYEDIGSSVGYANELKDITGTFVGMSLLILFVCAALSQLWFSRLP